MCTGSRWSKDWSTRDGQRQENSHLEWPDHIPTMRKSDMPDLSCLNFVVVVESLSHVWLFATPLIAAYQAPCLSPSPRACSILCPLSWWYHLTISFSVIPFSSCLQSFPATGSFLTSWFFTSAGQGIQRLEEIKLLEFICHLRPIHSHWWSWRDSSEWWLEMNP